MPLPKNTRFRYRELPEKGGRERRQRLAFAPRTNKVLEAKTEEKRKTGWIEVKGSKRNRGYTKEII